MYLYEKNFLLLKKENTKQKSAILIILFHCTDVNTHFYILLFRFKIVKMIFQ